MLVDWFLLSSCIWYVVPHDNSVFKNLVILCISAACDFSEGIRNIEHHQCSDKDLNPTENHATERHPEKCQSISVSNVHVEPCGTDAHASSLQHETSSLLLTEDRLNAEKAEFCNRSKQSGVAVSQQSRWAESKETCNDRQVPRTEEKVDPNADFLCGRKQWNHPKSLCPENSGATTDVPWITLNSSIQKVNEWFSRTGEMLTSDSASDRRHESNAEAAVVLEVSSKVDGCFSSSKKIDLVAPDPHNAVMCKSGRDFSKPIENNINDKVFGKTYQRKGSHPHLNHVTEIIGTFTTEPQITQEQPFTNKLKRKRSTCLQPEDFIKKADLTVGQRISENINQGTDQIEPNDQAMSTTSNGQENSTTGNNLQREKNVHPIESLRKEPAFTAKAKSISNSISDLEVELNVHSSKAPKKNRLRRKSSTRCVLPLEPISRNPSPPTCAELQIESCGSSEETKKNNSNQTPGRHIRDLQLMEDTEPAADAKKNEPNEHIRKRSANDAFPEEKLVNKAGLLTSCSSPRKPQGPVNPCPERKGIEQLETCQMPDNTKELRDLVLGEEPSDKPTEQSEESTSVSLVPDTDYDTQNSVSVLEANTVRYAKTGSVQCMTQFVASENPKELVHVSNNAGSGTECFKHPLRHELNHSPETMETEDSELDTQYLQNTFQVSKRQSFALFSKPRSPQKDCALVRAHSVPSREPSPKVTSKGEQKEHQGQEESEISHVQAVTVTVGLPVPCQKGKPGADTMCADVSRLCPSSHYRSCENGLSTTDKPGISQNSHFKQSVSPIRSSIKTDNRKTLTEGRFEKHTDKAMGNETTVQSTIHTISQNNRGNACQEASSGNIIEVCSTGENFQAELGRNRGPRVNTVLPLDSAQPGVCKQSAPVSDKYLEIKGEGKAVSADFSPCLFSDHLEQPMRSDKIFQVCSETPDDLLDDVEMQENTSFGEGDIMEKSAVFNGSILRRESSRSPSPVTHASKSRSLHRGSKKLESSEESDSTEDEDLPCFQHLLSRISNTPELTKCNSVVTQRVSEKAEGTQAPWKGSIGDCNNEVILVEASQEYQFSEDAKCSGSMFSSQHSAAQGSPANAIFQDPNFNPPSKQRHHQSENEEAFLSDKELISDNEDMAACQEEDNDQEEDSIIPDSGSFVYLHQSTEVS